MNHKVLISYTYFYGSWEIVFKKLFELPFAPYYDLVIDDSNEDTELFIDFLNNDFIKTRIEYSVNNKTFEVYIREKMDKKVSKESILEHILLFEDSFWERTDSTHMENFFKLLEFTKTYDPKL